MFVKSGKPALSSLGIKVIWVKKKEKGITICSLLDHLKDRFYSLFLKSGLKLNL